MVYHPPHGGIALQRVDRLFDDDSEWVFFESESRQEGPAGRYHMRGATVDPTRFKPDCEWSSRAEVERWRLDWVAKHDPDNVFNDDRSMVPTDGANGVFPVELSYLHSAR